MRGLTGLLCAGRTSGGGKGWEEKETDYSASLRLLLYYREEGQYTEEETMNYIRKAATMVLGGLFVLSIGVRGIRRAG